MAYRKKRSRQLAQIQKRSNPGFMLGLKDLWYKHEFKYHISDLDSEPGGGHKFMSRRRV